MKPEPLKGKKHSKSELDEKITIKGGWNPFGWYHEEDIKSAVKWFYKQIWQKSAFIEHLSLKQQKELRGLIDKAFEDVVKNEKEKKL